MDIYRHKLDLMNYSSFSIRKLQDYYHIAAKDQCDLLWKLACKIYSSLEAEKDTLRYFLINDQYRRALKDVYIAPLIRLSEKELQDALDSMPPLTASITVFAAKKPPKEGFIVANLTRRPGDIVLHLVPGVQVLPLYTLSPMSSTVIVQGGGHTKEINNARELEYCCSKNVYIRDNIRNIAKLFSAEKIDAFLDKLDMEKNYENRLAELRNRIGRKRDRFAPLSENEILHVYNLLQWTT